MILKLQPRIVVELTACSLCAKPAGVPCKKPSGGGRPPHAERRRAADRILSGLAIPKG